MKICNKGDIQRLIDNEVEESTVLEYKASFATQSPKWKEELAKDVSAMANSNGGIIIYGLKQKDLGGGNAVAGKLTPIPLGEMTKDRLSQLFSSNIQPKIDNVEITYLPDGENGGYFVVEIPQSDTAHQNRLDHIYYKRRNATIDAMEDYEIRDVMNRRKTPIIDLEFKLIITKVEVIKKEYDSITRTVKNHKYYRTEHKLMCRPINNGRILAKYINYFVYIPSNLVINKEESDIEGDYCVFFGDNTSREFIGFVGGQKKYGPVHYDPILPGIYGKSIDIDLCFDKMNANSIPCIKYEVHADNAPMRTHYIQWIDLPRDSKERSEIIDPMTIPTIPV